MKNLISFALLAAMLAGCAGPALRTKGGDASHTSASGSRAEIHQPENPKAAANQDLSVTDTMQIEVPAGSQIVMAQTDPESGLRTTNFVTVSTNTVLSRTHSEQSHAKVGAAQADIVGETVAKLASAKIFTVLGLIVFIGGVFAAVYPAAQALLGGFIPGAAIAGAGLLMAVLPFLIVGHEALFAVALVLTLAGAGVLIWAHKHGGIMAELNVLKNKAESEVKKL
jgi:hypothetical protein